MSGVALHPNFVDAAPFSVVDLRNRRRGKWEPGLLDQPRHPVFASEFERVICRREKQLLGGEVIIRFVSDECFEPRRQMRYAQLTELVIVICGEHSSPPFFIEATVVISATNVCPRWRI